MPSFLIQDTKVLEQELAQLIDRYEHHRSRRYSLNMSRGKPCAAQLDLSKDLITVLGPDDYRSEDGTDCRNYGGLEGIPEARTLFAKILGTSPENVLVFGNSSLNLMYDTVVSAMLAPVPGADKLWTAESTAFLCPSPGYDRHFAITQRLGFENIPVRMTPDGPDMDEVERLVASDPRIKGIWCVPVYSNPDGIVYSESTCRRLAAMQTAATDFRIFWDNAYSLHHLYPECKTPFPDMLDLCIKAGNANRVYEFTSTSKMTFAGAGISCMACSPANLAYRKSVMFYQTIGHDKLNQLRHVRYLKDMEGVEKLMARHAAILRPKFEAVLDILETELSDTGIARWNKPMGGYFISLFAHQGTAAEVIAMARACGVEFTPAGATYPGGKDPDDSNIRIAPSFPPVEELLPAAEVLCICVKIAAIRRILRDRAMA